MQKLSCVTPKAVVVSRKPSLSLRMIEGGNPRKILATPALITPRTSLRACPAAILRPDVRPSLRMPMTREGAHGIVDGAAGSGIGEALFAPALAQSFAHPPEHENIPNPYVDYARRYTPEGGVALTYKDVDGRLLLKIGKFLLWCLASGLTIWFAFTASPYPVVPPACRFVACTSSQLAAPIAFNAIGIMVMMIIYGIILAKPRHIYRSVEVRPDKFIVDDDDEFYRDRFELGWPIFQQTEKGMKLTAVYGTRFVHFFDIIRFDENDRMPEVFAANLQGAFQQLWTRPVS